MSTTLQCPPDCICGCHTAQVHSHIGAVHIMHGVTGGVVEYLLEQGDGDGASLAAALLNANQLLRNTLPEFALEEQAWPAAFTTVSDVGRMEDRGKRKAEGPAKRERGAE